MMVTMMGFGLIVPLLLVGVVAHALGWRQRFNQIRLSQTNHTPEEVLKVRYVQGAINHEEYEQMRRDLED